MIKRRAFLKSMVIAAASICLPPPAFAANQMTGSMGDDEAIRDYLFKMKNFDLPHPEDVQLASEDLPILTSSLQRLKRLQRTVGYGNFYLLSFDDALNIARHYPKVGSFSKAEIDFMEMIFYEDGTLYGFFGEKPLKKLTAQIPVNHVVKIPHSGNYLYRGDALDLYRKIKKDIGGNVVLTSGVRSVIKQFMLFLNKLHKSNGNLSLASRSLAPPGYSFHGVGDFDVGQAGYGIDNFTERFTETSVFRRLSDLGYVKLRYSMGNSFGVRFEPWHIKVGLRP